MAPEEAPAPDEGTRMSGPPERDPGAGPRSDHADPAPAGTEASTTDARLTFIGTGHVFRIDDAVRGAIVALRPDHVFVELDRGRLQALLARRRGEDTGRPRGSFVHRRLERFQREVAQMYGTEAGGEMLAAALAGRDVGARVHLIDPPAEDTLKRVVRALSWKERLALVGGLAKGTLKGLLPGQRRQGKQQVEAEIQRYQEDPAAALEELRRRYPTIHRIVIDERDERMAQALRAALPHVGHGVVVVGDGHLEGILRRLEDVPRTVYRLADTREGRLPSLPVASGTTERVSFGFETRMS